MISLAQALQNHDLIVLRVIGEWWELDLTGVDKGGSVKALAEALPQLDLAQEMLYLPPEEADAMRALIAGGGRLPVAAFRRQFGDVRLMGPAALEREEPWFDPASPAEALWYRGFLYLGFSDEGDGTAEYFFIPNELMAQFDAAPIGAAAEEEEEEADDSEPIYEDLDQPEDDYFEEEGDEVEAAEPPPPPPAKRPAARPQSQSTPQPEQFEAATTHAVDDMTTLLAMAQVGKLAEGAADQFRPYLLHPSLDRLALLKTLAVEMGLLRLAKGGYRPARAAVEWLQQGRESQLRALAEAWSGSAWNELRHLPTLRCEGSGWSNDPIAARTAVYDALTLTEEAFPTADLIGRIKKENPDFQRPNGNYDTWYIRDLATGDYLRGFENWELVEGRLLSYILQAPMVWLGLVETNGRAFRLTERAVQWLSDQVITDRDQPAPIIVENDGAILVPLNASRYHRFQTARIATMLPVAEGEPYRYRITASTLDAANRQKITPQRALQFLEKTSGQPVPPTTKRAITRWAEEGTEGQIEEVIVLRVRDAKILETLRQQPKTRPFIGESLGELAAVVHSADWSELASAAAQLGLLLDGPS